MEYELKGERALITGGSKGIGKAIAQELAAAGADVLIVSSNQERLAKAHAEIKASARGQANYFVADLRRLSECRALAEWALKGTAGKSAEQEKPASLSILINAAGATRGGDFLALEDEVWQDGFALKFYACVRLCRLLWKSLAANKGKVVNIVGGFARTPRPRLHDRGNGQCGNGELHQGVGGTRNKRRSARQCRLSRHHRD